MYMSFYRFKKSNFRSKSVGNEYDFTKNYSLRQKLTEISYFLS
jgi:hypothetical protein